MSESVGRLAMPLGPGTPAPGNPGPGGPAGPVPPGPGNQLTAGGLPPQMPGPGPQAPRLGPMPSGIDGVHQALRGGFGQAKAAYEQTGKALGMIDHMRKGLERLADKGDMVTPDDIISEAGKLVAHGIDPMALAGVLAEMPQEGGGEALGGWVVGHAIAAAQAEQQVMAAHSMARHQMGVAAIHAITAHDVSAALAPPEPQGTMDGGNQLAGADQPPPAPIGGNNALSIPGGGPLS